MLRDRSGDLFRAVYTVERWSLWIFPWANSISLERQLLLEESHMVVHVQPTASVSNTAPLPQVDLEGPKKSQIQEGDKVVAVNGG